MKQNYTFIHKNKLLYENILLDDFKYFTYTYKIKAEYSHIAFTIVYAWFSKEYHDIVQ